MDRSLFSFYPLATLHYPLPTENYVCRDTTRKQHRRPIDSITMQVAVYRGVNDVRLESVPVPQIEAGEILVRVHSCGICGTDLKKIATGSHSAPRIFSNT